MRRSIPRILLGVLILQAAWAEAQVLTARPQLQALPLEVRELVLTWLWRDCGASQQRTLEERLAAIGSRLEPVFWEAYRLGPPPEALEGDRAAFAERYGERQKWLRQSGEELFGKEEVERLLKVTRSQYVQRELDNAITGYRTAAVAGLGLVGTQDSRDELARIAENPDDPAHVAAKEAINSLRQRSPS
jgi:hypothetical protein